MKKIRTFLALTLTALIMTALASCGKIPVFEVKEITDDHITFSAENVEKGSTLYDSPFTMENGGEVSISADLKSGNVKAELIVVPEGKTMNDIIDHGGDVILTYEKLKTTEGGKAIVTAGTYMVKLTSVEKVTGTVTVSINRAE